jgi:hypothetical protein
VYADFRDGGRYFETVFDLILSIYGISPRVPAVAELVRQLRERL